MSKKRRTLPGQSVSTPLKRGRGLPGQSSAAGDPGLTIKVTEHISATLITNELIQIGDPGAGNYIEITDSAITLFQDGEKKIALESDGDVFIGRDLSAPAATHLIVFSTDQTYNSESFTAGDMLIGDNTANQPNLLWDEPAGELHFRTGQSTALTLDVDGIRLEAGATDINKLKFASGSNIIGQLYAAVDPGVDGRLSLVGRGEDSSTHEGAVEIVAITDDGTTHAGAASVSLELATSNKQITLAAEKVKAAQTLVPGVMTTTTRDALSPLTGAIIWNITDSKLQVYTGSAWANLH